jgi:hypothetical protein
MHLVLASYNAGERPVHRWVGERPGLASEEFIDDIPYPETQNYVRKILGTAEDYRRIYGSPAGLGADEAIPAVTTVVSAADVDPSLRTKKASVASTAKKAPAATAVKKAAAAKKKQPTSKPVRKRRRAA